MVEKANKKLSIPSHEAQESLEKTTKKETE